MACAAAEQSVPLPAASRAAQHLLERGIGLPKVAEANPGSCDGRGRTDGQTASCSSQPRGSCRGPYECPVATHLLAVLWSRELVPFPRAPLQGLVKGTG